MLDVSNEEDGQLCVWLTHNLVYTSLKSVKVRCKK